MADGRSEPVRKDSYPSRQYLNSIGGNQTALLKRSEVLLEMFITPLIQLFWSEGCCVLDHLCSCPSYFCSQTEVQIQTGFRVRDDD